MMLRALAEAARVLERADFLEAADKNAEFLLRDDARTGRPPASDAGSRVTRRSSTATWRITPTSRTGCWRCTRRRSIRAG